MVIKVDIKYSRYIHEEEFYILGQGSYSTGLRKWRCERNNAYMSGEHRYAGSEDNKKQDLILKLDIGLELDEFHDLEYLEVDDVTRVMGLGLDSIHDPEYLEVERKSQQCMM